MHAPARLLRDEDSQRIVGKGVGLLVGVLGLLVSVAALFVPVSYIVAPGVTEQMAGIDYLLGNPTAERIFNEAVFRLLVSLSIIYMVTTDGIRTLWLTTAIIGTAGIGGLQYGGTSGMLLFTAAVLLAISTAFLTVSRGRA